MYELDCSYNQISHLPETSIVNTIYLNAASNQIRQPLELENSRICSLDLSDNPLECPQTFPEHFIVEITGYKGREPEAVQA
jgi:hypothetical protein